MAARASTLGYRTRPQSDIYTGMLVVSLLAMILGCVLLYLDYDQYQSMKAPALPQAPAVAPRAEAPAPAPPAGGAPGGAPVRGGTPAPTNPPPPRPQ